MTISTHLRQSHRTPSLLLRWLGRVLSVDVIGSKQVPASSSVVVLKRGQKWLLDSASESVFAGHRGFNIVAVMELPADRLEALKSLSTAMSLARSISSSILPVAVLAAPALSLPFAERVTIPLPGARLIAVVQAPFEIPRQPDAIPNAWVEAIQRLVDQANGLAADRLATWKHQGF